jgi:hypothetical protein
MKQPATLVLFSAIATFGTSIFSAPILSDNFNSYNNGALVGQGNWAQTGSSVVNPVQVNSGVVSLTTSGQDVYDPFTSAVTLTDGQSLYIGMTLDVSAAQTAGDYFLHFDPTVGDASAFYDRLFVKATTGGYLLGWEGTAAGGGTVAYGTGVLTLGTSYDIVLAYNYSAATTTAATAAIYVNPTDPTIGNNTAYQTFAWTGTGADTNLISEVNLRQGTASSAPTLTLDNLVASESFGDVVPAPEPSTLALAAFGGLASLFVLRRKR